MKKLNLAIIGQGRSGKQIHGAYYLSDKNEYYNVKYVVEEDELRRAIAKEQYSGSEVLSSYIELFTKRDVDVVVNASYSQQHFLITKDLLEHKFNVLVEKPFSRTKKECEQLMAIAKENGVALVVFQQSFYAPYYLHSYKTMNEGILGKVEQISIRFNNFARRWDWQTLQKNVAGNAYNTGPHPIGIALGLLVFSEDIKIEYCKLAHTSMSSGDADDYVKVILTAPNKPVVDVEINSIDAYNDYTIKMQGHKGTFKCNLSKYQLKYIVDGENPPKPVQESFLQDENGEPLYCWEELITHEQEGTYEGTAFDVGTAELYKEMYYHIAENKPMSYTAEMASNIIGVIESLHKTNPLPKKF